MGFPVGGQLPRLCVAVPTNVAHVGFLSCVGSSVALQSAGIPKGFAAGRAHVVSDAQMRSFVGSQVARGVVAFRALVAEVGFFTLKSRVCAIIIVYQIVLMFWKHIHINENESI